MSDNEKGTEDLSPKEPKSFNLKKIEVTKEQQVIAVTTPIPTANGIVSKKTPIFHLPVYRITMQSDNSGKGHSFHCDLADLTDLKDKLKSYQNQWRRYGRVTSNNDDNNKTDSNE